MQSLASARAAGQLLRCHGHPAEQAGKASGRLAMALRRAQMDLGVGVALVGRSPEPACGQRQVFGHALAHRIVDRQIVLALGVALVGRHALPARRQLEILPSALADVGHERNPTLGRHAALHRELQIEPKGIVGRAGKAQAPVQRTAHIHSPHGLEPGSVPGCRVRFAEPTPPEASGETQARPRIGDGGPPPTLAA